MTALASRPVGYCEPGRVYPRHRLREGYARRRRARPELTPSPSASDPRVSDHLAAATPTPDVPARAGAGIGVAAQATPTPTLKASAVMAPFTSLEMVRGEDRAFRFTFAPVPDGGIAGWVLTFGLRLEGGSVPLVTKTAAITDAAAGVFTVTLDSADTSGLDVDTYIWDVRRQPAGVKDTVARGELTIYAEVVP